MRADNHLLRATDDGLDAARGIVTALLMALACVVLPVLVGMALFGNP